MFNGSWPIAQEHSLAMAWPDHGLAMGTTRNPRDPQNQGSGHAGTPDPAPKENPNTVRNYAYDFAMLEFRRVESCQDGAAHSHRPLEPLRKLRNARNAKKNNFPLISSVLRFETTFGIFLCRQSA